MVRIGIIGYSEQNGHPYSFSSILNGFNSEEFKKTEWTGILNYLQKREDKEIASLDAKVTHIWTQDLERSKEIARCCYIENIVENYIQLIRVVDAVIIARDDYETHKDIAKPFLENNIPVLIDKPLTLDKDELKWFLSYYDSGLLMSTSGLRFCKELDEYRKNPDEYGEIVCIRTAVVNCWEKYGIHMLDSTLGIIDKKVKTISCQKNPKYNSYFINFEDNLTLQIDTLGSDFFAFSYEIIGKNKSLKIDIRDNFSSFKRMLETFIIQIKNKQPSIPKIQIERSIYTLIAGIEAKNTGEIIYVKR